MTTLVTIATLFTMVGVVVGYRYGWEAGRNFAERNHAEMMRKLRR